MDGDQPWLSNDATLRSVLTAGFDAIVSSIPELQYRLVGTAAARLQGVDLPVGDIDLLVQQRSDVEAVGHALRSFPCLVAPTALEHAPQYYACYRVEGAEFSVSTLEVHCGDSGWECKGPSPWQFYSEVVCGHHNIKCVRLELRLGTEFARDRPDRYEPILAHLRRHGANLELLSQVSQARRLSNPAKVLLRQIRSAPTH